MRRITAITLPAFALLFAAPLHAAPANPGSQCVETPTNAEAFKLGRQVVDTIIPSDSGDAMMKQLMGSIVTQMRNGMNIETDDAGAQAILDKHLNRIPEVLGPLVARFLPRMKEATACAYTHEFSVEELREISAFAATPSGRHYLSRSTAMISDPAVAIANQAYFSELKFASKQFEAEIAADLTDYYKTKKLNKK